MAPRLLDDNDPDLDDLAGIAESTMSDVALLGELVGEPIETEDVTVTPSYNYMSGMSLDLEPQNGVLMASVTIEDPFIQFDLTDIAGYSWVSTDGQAWMDSITVEIGLSPQSLDGQTSVRWWMSQPVTRVLDWSYLGSRFCRRLSAKLVGG